MRLDIYSPDLVRRASFFSWLSLLWSPKYNEAGTFQAEFQEESGILGLIKPFDYITVDFDPEVMIVTSMQYKDKKIIVNGKSAVYLLNSRASTTVVKNQNAEEAMRSLVNNMTPWNKVSLGESAGLTDIFTAQTSDGSILEYCTSIGQATDMGFRFRKSGDSLLFECYKPPLNTGVRFAANLGNMGNETYTESELDFANVAIVAGAGEGDARIHVTIGDTSAEGADRREVYLDARHIQPEDGETDDEYLARLSRYGENKLSELQKIRNVGFSITDENIALGDLVKITSLFENEPYQARISGISYKSQNNILTKTISVGTLVPTRKRG